MQWRPARWCDFFFLEHEPWREPTRRVLTQLRKDKLLNTHGRDGKGVGQKLKTVSAALLCISVLEDVGGDRGAFPNEASVDHKTLLLYQRMALFDANALLFKFSRKAHPRKCTRSLSGPGLEAPLLLLVENQNSPQARNLSLIHI